MVIVGNLNTPNNRFDMPFTHYPATTLFAPEARAVDLLLDRDHLSDDWEVDLAPHRLFYVRGFTEFKRRVTGTASVIGDYIPSMKSQLAMLDKWGPPNLKWDSDFSQKQVSAMANKKRLSFEKAAQAILLCGITAAELAGQNKAEAARAAIAHMRIQPATFFIHGLNEDFLDKLDAKDNNLENLRRATHQFSKTVFHDMAERQRVTYQLCDAIKKHVSEFHPELYLGEIDARTTSRPSASENENIDLR